MAMANLLLFLRETGVRLAEALQLRAQDIHPCGTKATLRLGVKRNRGEEGGSMTRTIDLGRAAGIVADLPKKGRLFAELHADSAVTSTRYGQWCRQRQGREDRLAKEEGREAVQLDRYRLHDLRHAFAVASLVDDPDCLFRLSLHLGHSKTDTTEIYIRHLRKDGAQWHYDRRPETFGSLTIARQQPTSVAA
jgi:integrase